MTNPMTPSLQGYARYLINRGRTAAEQARTGPLESAAEYAYQLDQIERDLAKFLLVLGPGPDVRAEEAALDIGRYAGGKHPRTLARAWARLACRGHQVGDIGWPDDPAVWDAAGGFAAALAAAGVEPERWEWTSGISQAEAEGLCAALGVPAPPALVDVDARVREAQAADDAAARARGEDPDDW